MPLTVEGTIVVNGIFASCYASFDHDLADWAMSPLKWFPEMLEWIFDEVNGMVFIDIAKNIRKSLLPYGQLYQGSKIWWIEFKVCVNIVKGIKCRILDFKTLDSIFGLLLQYKLMFHKNEFVKFLKKIA